MNAFIPCWVLLTRQKITRVICFITFGLSCWILNEILFNSLCLICYQLCFLASSLGTTRHCYYYIWERVAVICLQETSIQVWRKKNLLQINWNVHYFSINLFSASLAPLGLRSISSVPSQVWTCFIATWISHSPWRADRSVRFRWLKWERLRFLPTRYMDTIAFFRVNSEGFPHLGRSHWYVSYMTHLSTYIPSFHRVNSRGSPYLGSGHQGW